MGGVLRAVRTPCTTLVPLGLARPGFPFTTMLLHYKKVNNKWLSCLPMEFKGPCAGVAVWYGLHRQEYCQL